jgi:Secretion system C-terminal sorting domain
MTMNRYDSAAAAEVIYVSQSWLLTPTTTWAHLALPINYMVTDTFKPDSIQLIFLSSVASVPHRGTTLWLDTIHFDASVDIIDTVNTGIANIGNSATVEAYPNPAGNNLNVILPQQEVGSIIEIIDATGQVLYRTTTQVTDNTIDTKNYCEGIYTLRIYSADRLTTYRGKVSILHSQ